MTSDLVNLVAGCARETAALDELSLPADLGPDTPLFGKEGVFDSLGIVNLVVAVEEAIQDSHGVAVSLADQRALSQKHSPYRTIGSLATYAEQLIRRDD